MTNQSINLISQSGLIVDISATHAIENAAVRDPGVFDGLRNYRKRQEKESVEHHFSSPDTTVLNFGFGKTACPGRFFASVMLKILFTKLVTEYEFKFLPGAKRPKNILVHEFLFPYPWDRMLIRKKEGTCPF
ncbi:hypothetical protein BDV95DRAFT_602044 [Massariosphaeria phaeospora]|uniref:Cytochrome P450 n=1 Tax=Massariosphaeria phaeospora TaxID=100035 RepID=A0A7C8MDD6_9PLEO|nr:hypothetical protein BDV95DRAFT_602044 [Massariosphaeria phaeospora]